MEYGKNNHYQNKHGQQLNEFLKANMDNLAMASWYLLQALKYVVRAGKKSHESESKDLGKAEDYLKELAEITGINIGYLEDEIAQIKEDFENWEG